MYNIHNIYTKVFVRCSSGFAGFGLFLHLLHMRKHRYLPHGSHFGMRKHRYLLYGSHFGIQKHRYLPHGSHFGAQNGRSGLPGRC